MTRVRSTPVDVLVVGAGPAGLRSAVAAAERGKRVLVLDQGMRSGGQIWRHRSTASLPAIARRWFDRVQAAGVGIAHGARVVDALSPSELVVDFHGRIDRQRTDALVIATGARERLLPFPGWTLPGVVGVGGMQALIKSGLLLDGARVVIAGSGPLLFPVAGAVAEAGADLRLVAEQAPRRELLAFAAALVAKPAALVQAASYRWRFRRAPFRTACWIARAEGDGRVRRVHVVHRGKSWVIECDWLATSAGLVPQVELAALLGCALTADAVQVDATQATTVPGVWAAGECTGIKGDAAALVEGEIAGASAAGDGTAARRTSLQRRRASGVAFGRRLEAHFAPRRELHELATPETIICRCEDVRRADIDPAWSQRQAKLWTRVGMGECQGAVCGPVCSALFGWGLNATRPPVGNPLCGGWSGALSRDT